MAQKRIVKVEKYKNKWAVVGQLTGQIYHNGTRLDCCVSLGDNREDYERWESESHDGYLREQAVIVQGDDWLRFADENGYPKEV